MSTKLTSKWILAFSGSDHVLVENGEVIMQDRTIRSVGPRSDRPADEVHDYGRALIAPGFVDLNALADVDCTILRYAQPTGAVLRTAWSRDYAEHRRRDVLSADQRVAGARAAFAQLLLSGITTALPVTSLLAREWAETAEEFDRIADLAEELGIRLVLGPSFRSAVNVIEPDGSVGQVVDEERGRSGLRGAVEFIKNRAEDSNGLISGLLVPSTIETCSDTLLVDTAAAAAELGVPYRLHCCQSRTEAELIWKRSGRASIAHLQALGVLSRLALLPHAMELGGPEAEADLARADVETLAASGSVVVHCPLVVGRGGRRLESFGAFRQRGIRIGLGTDTAPPDMLMNLQLGVATSRMGDAGAEAGPAEYFRAATLGGANAIGRPDLGRVAAGAAADLVVWDMARLDVQPVKDPVEALFLMPPGGRARDVWIAGRRVVIEGGIPALDEAALSASVGAAFDALKQAYAERHPEGLGCDELFPPPFPSMGVAQIVRH